MKFAQRMCAKTEKEHVYQLIGWCERIAGADAKEFASQAVQAFWRSYCYTQNKAVQFASSGIFRQLGELTGKTDCRPMPRVLLHVRFEQLVIVKIDPEKNPCAIKRTGCKTTPAVRRAAIPLIYKLYIIVKRQQVTPQTSFGNYSGPYIMSGRQNVRGLPLGQGRYLRVPFVWLRLVLLTDTSHWERY